jgi:hypothetical protein
MKVSPNGANILDGKGLHSVRERIQQAFESVRVDVRTDFLAQVLEEIEITEEVEFIDLDLEHAHEPLRPLAERVETIVTAAEQGLQHTADWEPHSAVHYIAVPTETPEQLYAEALRASEK